MSVHHILSLEQFINSSINHSSTEATSHPLLANKYNNNLGFGDFSDVVPLTWVIFCVGLPIIGIAMYRLYSMIKRDHAAPIYVIHLLISDVLQISASPIAKILPQNMLRQVLEAVMNLGLIGSVCFMVCIAGERYFMSVHPVWYRLHKTVKMSVIVCVIFWSLCISGVIIIAALIVTGHLTHETYSLCAIVFHLLPYPLILFFFVGTWRGLSRSKFVRQHERRRILGTLALVLCIYTVFFLPHIVMFITVAAKPQIRSHHSFYYLFISSRVLLYLSPLFDPILYVFMRTDVKDIKVTCLCFGRVRNDQDQTDIPISFAAVTTSEEIIKDRLNLWFPFYDDLNG